LAVDLYFLPKTQRELRKIAKDSSIEIEFKQFFEFMKQNVGVYPYDPLLKYLAVQLKQYTNCLRRFKRKGRRQRCLHIWYKGNTFTIIVKVWIRGAYGPEEGEYAKVIKDTAVALNEYEDLDTIIAEASKYPLNLVF